MIGAVSVAFVGLVLLLGVLIDELLRLVGIDWIERLWATEWFGWAVAGAAFGAVAARLRDRAGLLGMLLTVKFTVLAVLAPVLAVGIAVFLGALPFGGLATFWTATGSSTVILLACAGLAVWLVNAVLGNHSGSARGEGSGEGVGGGRGVGGRVLRGSALVLALTVLPLALIGAAGLWIRVNALGWTPTRLWGVAAIGVAAVWGGTYLRAIVRARGLDDAAIFAGNVRMAVGVAALALLLAVPLVDFGAISTRSQLARLEDGSLYPYIFDWDALATEFGPAGRRALEGIVKSGKSEQWQAAAEALNPEAFASAQDRSLPLRIEIAPADAKVPASFVKALINANVCSVGLCQAWKTAPDEIVVAGFRSRRATHDDVRDYTAFKLKGEERWILATRSTGTRDFDVSVEVVPVTRRQLVIGGKPVGDPFE